MPYELSIKEESGILHLYLTGNRTWETFLAVVKDISNACEKHQCRKVILDTRDMTGRLKTLEQYDLPNFIPKELKKIRLAEIEKEKDKDKWRFFETSARNKGYNMRTFTNEKAAKHWLLSQ